MVDTAWTFTVIFTSIIVVLFVFAVLWLKTPHS